MPLVIASWPNGTISVVSMRSGFTMVDLFHELDAEANPTDAQCYCVKPSADGLHVTCNWDSRRRTRLRLEAMHGGSLAPLKWPPRIVERYYRSLRLTMQEASGGR